MTQKCDYCESETELGRPVICIRCASDLIVEFANLRSACRFALEQWFDRVYPPDIFVGGPSSDPAVNEVREVVDKLRAALEKTPDEAPRQR